MQDGSIHKALVEYRTGDMFAPHVAQTEALSLMTADFVKAIATGSTPISDARAGLNVVRILEAADRSLKMGGMVISLSRNGDPQIGVRLEELEMCAAAKRDGVPCPLQAFTSVPSATEL